MQKQSDKLSVIKKVLNGTLSIQDLLPQNVFVINIRNGRYEVNGKGMSKDEYEKWKVINVREQDILFITELPEPDKEIVNAITPKPLFKFPSLKAIKKPVKKGKEPEAKQIAIKEIVNLEPERKTRGKLSEYGITWGNSSFN